MNSNIILAVLVVGITLGCSGQLALDPDVNEYPYVSLEGAVISDEYARFVGYVVGARYQHKQGNLKLAESLYESAISIWFHEVPNYAAWGEYSYLLSMSPSNRERSLDYYRAYRWAYEFLSGNATCVDVAFESPNVANIVLRALCTEDVDGFVFGEKNVGWSIEERRMAQELEVLRGIVGP